MWTTNDGIGHRDVNRYVSSLSFNVMCNVIKSRQVEKMLAVSRYHPIQYVYMLFDYHLYISDVYLHTFLVYVVEGEGKDLYKRHVNFNYFTIAYTLYSLFLPSLVFKTPQGERFPNLIFD